MQKYQITWPEGIDSKSYPVHSYNELFIPAKAEDIWQVLINATTWPKWYYNAKDVKIMSGELNLNLHTKFTWKTFGLQVKSQVQVFDPFTDLGWDAQELAGNGFHGWKIIPQDNGCLVITEEVQGGWGPMILRKIIEKNLVRQHQKWLEGIAEQIKITK